MARREGRGEKWGHAVSLWQGAIACMHACMHSHLGGGDAFAFTHAHTHSHLGESDAFGQLLRRCSEDIALVARRILERVKIEGLMLDAYSLE